MCAVLNKYLDMGRGCRLYTMNSHLKITAKRIKDGIREPQKICSTSEILI